MLLLGLMPPDGSRADSTKLRTLVAAYGQQALSPAADGSQGDAMTRASNRKR